MPFPPNEKVRCVIKTLRSGKFAVIEEIYYSSRFGGEDTITDQEIIKRFKTKKQAEKYLDDLIIED